MATAAPATGADQLVGGPGDVFIQDLEQFPGLNLTRGTGCGGHGEVCAICLDKIELEETALIKGCEHAYCVTCILHWATYQEKPTCPQCKHPLEFLNIHRSLDGRLHDYMLEESVCLLVRAVWFKPLDVEDYAHAHDESEVYNPYGYDYDYDYDYEYDDEDEIRAAYLGNSSSSSSSGNIRIGNRRWGDNGYVRGGRQEARPLTNRDGISTPTAASSSSRQQQPNKQQKESSASVKEGYKIGRRAKRALKREAEDKAAAAKHQTHLERLGLDRN